MSLVQYVPSQLAKSLQGISRCPSKYWTCCVENTRLTKKDRGGKDEDSDNLVLLLKDMKEYFEDHNLDYGISCR